MGRTHSGSPYRYVFNKEGDNHESLRAALDFFANVAKRPLRPMGTAAPKPQDPPQKSNSR